MIIALSPAVDMLLATQAATPPAEAVAPTGKYSKEALEKMLAPIALYPDILLAQVLGAATKPQDVVAASQFMAQPANKELKGDVLEKTVEAQPWDENVKALCQFKETLATMAKKIDETKKLGEAYLDQHGDVMATVQGLRKKAKEAGNLKSSEQMKVEVEGPEIVIVASNPQVIYVPTYNPTYVYGPWWYPAPPCYWYSPKPGPGVGFVVGVAVGLSWNNNHRRRHRRNRNVNVNVNVNRNNNRNRNNNVNVNVNKNKNTNRNVNVNTNNNKNTNVNVNRNKNTNRNVNVNSNSNKNTNVNVNNNRNKNNSAARGNDSGKVSTKSRNQSNGFSGMSSGNSSRQSRERGKKSRSSNKSSRGGKSGGRKRR